MLIMLLPPWIQQFIEQINTELLLCAKLCSRHLGNISEQDKDSCSFQAYVVTEGSNRLRYQIGTSISDLVAGKTLWEIVLWAYGWGQLLLFFCPSSLPCHHLQGRLNMPHLHSLSYDPKKGGHGPEHMCFLHGWRKIR